MLKANLTVTTVTKEEWFFQDLKAEETRLLLIRHPEHKDNIISPGELAKLEKQGEKLAETGLTIAHGYASRFARAIDSVLWTCRGMNKMVPLNIDTRWDDFSVEGPEKKEVLKAAAKTAGVDVGLFLFDPRAKEVVPDIEEIMIRRASKGSQFLVQVATNHRGETVLIGGHGGSRIEISVLCLQHQGLEKLKKPPVLLMKGQIMEVIVRTAIKIVFRNNQVVILCSNYEVVEINYLPLGWE